MPRSKNDQKVKAITAKKQEPQGKTGPKADLKPGETQHRFRVQFDVGYRGTPGKKMSQEQNTVPDMSLTVRQLVENHTRGHDSNVHVSQPLYFDTEVPVFTDLTDVDAYRNHLKNQMELIDEQIKQERANAKTENASNKAEVNKSSDNKGETVNAGNAGQERIPDA